MGPVRQNPIQRPVRSVHVCALNCAQLLHTILNRTDLIVFPLTLQTITTSPMMSIWGKGGGGPGKRAVKQLWWCGNRNLSVTASPVMHMPWVTYLRLTWPAHTGWLDADHPSWARHWQWSSLLNVIDDHKLHINYAQWDTLNWEGKRKRTESMQRDKPLHRSRILLKQHWWHNSCSDFSTKPREGHMHISFINFAPNNSDAVGPISLCLDSFLYMYYCMHG